MSNVLFPCALAARAGRENRIPANEVRAAARRKYGIFLTFGHRGGIMSVRTGGPMKSRRRAVLATVLALGLVFAWTSVSYSDDRVAPDFTLPSITGEDLQLSELLEEGPVIVDFWATWCKPCIKAFPELQSILDNYTHCGLRVVAVSIDGPRSSSKVPSFIKSKGFTFDVVLDPGQKVARKYHVTSVPRTVLVGQNGREIFAYTGYRPSHHRKMEEALEELFPEGCEEPEDETAETAEDAGE
ncbi:MAG: redoxin domain-containing protein [Candidatus Eisenbacteria bacterium]|nr:redoxin domain-containing protein [Candidatus Eisenbacteria bacterium]